MKKWTYIMIIGLLMTLMTACASGSANESTSTKTPANSEGKTVVTLSMQQPSDYYRTVEKKFEAKYPDIDLQIQLTEDYEKYQKTTNAALLSGKGPDIFEVSSLPIEAYVSKELLLNMDEPMADDKTLNKSDLQTNVLNVLKLNGGMYAIPSGFNLRAFVGDGDILKNASFDDKKWTWKEFEETSKKLGESGTERRYALANASGNPPARNGRG